MIDLDRDVLHVDGVAVFSDHADPARFWYVPDGPRLRTLPDGRPDLALLKYQLDPALRSQLGAGLLNVTVDLAVDSDRTDAIRHRLQTMTGSPVTLGPVEAQAGSCDLFLIDRSSSDASAAAPPGAETAPIPPGPGLVERIAGSAPALFGDNQATFSAVLSAEGASLVEASIGAGDLPAGAIYALQVPALRPAVRARVTARWADAYHFLENRLHGGKLLLATDIGPTIEGLVHDEAISVVIDDLVPAEDRDAAYDRAIEQVTRYVMSQFFQPTLGQAPPPADPESGLATIGRALKDILGGFAITYSLRDVDRNELKTFEYDLSAAQAELLTLSPQGTLAGALSNYPDRASLITAITPGTPSEMTFDIAPIADLASLAIDHLEVTIGYGGESQVVILDSSTPRRQVSVWYRTDAGLTVTWRYEAHFLPTDDTPAQILASEPRSTDHRVIRIDPSELFTPVSLTVVADAVPFDRYTPVVVDVHARDLASDWTTATTLRLDPGHREAGFQARAPLAGRALLEVRVRYEAADGTEQLIDWREVDPGYLVLGDPQPDVVDVQIAGSARFGSVIRQLIVELRPTDRPTLVASRVLSADQPTATWSWRVGPSGDRSWEYRVTQVTTQSGIIAGTWLAGPPGATLIVGEGVARFRAVRMLFVGRSLAQAGLLALKVRFAAGDPTRAEDERLIEDLRQPVEWSYPVTDERDPGYSYQLTRIGADGQQLEQPPVATNDLLVVISV